MAAAPHALVIGGGPAGSAAATSLAARGWRVTLVESRPFPRIKVCGEFISPAATALLHRLISPTDLRAAGARRIDTLVLEHGRRSATWRMPSPAWSIGRATLDTLLLEQARAAGASVLQPERIVGVEYHDDHVAAKAASGLVLHADVVIHADGAGRHDPAGPTPNRRGVVALKCHLRAGALPILALHMRSAPGAYVGASPIDRGQVTLALVARASLLAAHRGKPDDVLTTIWPGFLPHWRTTDWLACGVPASGYIAPGQERSFRIGNAAAAVEPVGGEGIGLALWSGVMLAEILSSAPDLRAAQRAMARRYRRRLLMRRPACLAAAAVLARPRLAGALWPTLALPSLSLRPWYALTGKPLSETPASS